MSAYPVGHVAGEQASTAPISVSRLDMSTLGNAKAGSWSLEWNGVAGSPFIDRLMVQELERAEGWMGEGE